MKNQQHTPGPWGIEQTREANWIGPMRQSGAKVAEIVCNTDREGLTEDALARNDANARLIAAAPELLDALHAIYDVASGERQVADNDTEGMAWVARAASAALAKATPSPNP